MLADSNVLPVSSGVGQGQSLLRALKQSGVRQRFPSDLTDAQLLDTSRDGLVDLCARLDRAQGCRAQLVRVAGSALRQLGTCDTWVLVPDDAGWWVVGANGVTHAPDGGLQATTERSFTRLRALEGEAQVRAIVLEFDLGLDAIRHEGPGLPSPWRRLRSLLRLESRELWSLLIYSVLLGLLSLAVPTAVQVLVNSIAMAQLVQPLVVLSLLLFAVLALTGATELLRSYAAEVLQRRIFVRIAEDFASRIPKLGRATSDGIHLPERCQRFFEVITVQKSLSVLVVDGLGLVLRTVAGLALLGFYHPLLLAFDGALLVGFALIAAAGYGAVQSANEESLAKYRVAAWIKELAVHADRVRSTTGARLAKERVESLVGDYLRSRKIHYRKLFRQLSSGVFMHALSMVSLLGLGGYLVMKGELTLGQLVAAELVVGMIVTGFTKVSKYLEKLYDLLAGLDKLGLVVDMPFREMAASQERPISLVLDAQPLESGRAQLESTQMHVGRHYEIRSTSALSLRALRAGLLGHRIGEQQQLLRASAHFADLLSATPVGAEQLAQWTMVLQQTHWVEMTILDQLRLADPSLNQERALALLERVQLSDWVRSLPSSVHTRCVTIEHLMSPERAASLALARILLAQPPIVLLDGWLDSPEIPTPAKGRLKALLQDELPNSIVLSSVLMPAHEGSTDHTAIVQKMEATS